MTSKVWTQDEIKALIENNDVMVKHSVLKLYDCQTVYEKRDAVTAESNNVGFNYYDAPFLTSIAQQLKIGYSLSEKQLKETRRRIRKYSKQLTKIANNEI